MCLSYNDGSHSRRDSLKKMNDLLFFIHITILILCILAALRIGKNALTSILVVQVILGNLLVTKQTILFGLNVTCSEVYTIGALFSLNLLQTYFGKRRAQEGLLITFFLLFFFVVMSQIHLRYLPSKYDSMHPIFSRLLDSTPRIMLSSFFCALLTQKLDLELFAFLRQNFSFLPFSVVFVLSSLLTQFLDTILFSFFALYGTVHSIKDIVLMSYAVKGVTVFSVAPFTGCIKRWVRDVPL